MFLLFLLRFLLKLFFHDVFLTLYIAVGLKNMPVATAVNVGSKTVFIASSVQIVDVSVALFVIIVGSKPLLASSADKTFLKILLYLL